ncbi:MAG: mechanosensitive ion channel [Brachymonas sp.]|nr:mechanosensitive ion channel [Brachymonas sp.]
MNDNNYAATLEEWSIWLETVLQPSTLKQLAAIVGMGLLAWLAVYAVRKYWQRRVFTVEMGPPVMLGVRNYDGLLFPALWFTLTYISSLLMQVPVRQSIFRVAMPIILALVLIRTGAIVLRTTLGAGRRWVRVLEQTVSWTVWISMVLWVTGLLPWFLEYLNTTAIKFGPINTTLLGLLLGSVSVVASLLLALWVASLVEARLLRDAHGSTLSLRKIISNAIRGVLLFLALLFGLRAANIDLTAFSVFGGALGVGIGLGLQKIAANYVSGFVVLLERSIRVGDMIKVDGFDGRVIDISARFTRLRSHSGVDAILPNDMLVNQRVENSSTDQHRVWIWFPVTVSFDSDIALVQRLLVDVALGQERVLRDPPPAAHLHALGDNGMDFRLGFWIADPEKSTLSLRTAINIGILRTLNEHKIEIPYPQRTVRVQMPQAAAGSQATLFANDEPGA